MKNNISRKNPTSRSRVFYYSNLSTFVIQPERPFNILLSSDLISISLTLSFQFPKAREKIFQVKRLWSTQ
ncbi:MAG: hypothetical protein QG561_409 [Patescibacteria group bacterium]|nr:hypothetical protein [Patescibacteria group bacterium]